MGASESTPYPPISPSRSVENTNASSRYSVVDEYQPDYRVTSSLYDGNDTTPTKKSSCSRYLSTTQTPPAYKRINIAVPSTQTPPLYKHRRYSSSSSNGNDGNVRRTLDMYELETPERDLKYDAKIHGRGAAGYGWWPTNSSASRYGDDFAQQTAYEPTDTIPFGMETSYGPTDTIPLYYDDSDEEDLDVFRFFNPATGSQDVSAVQSVRRSFSSSLDYYDNSEDYSQPPSPTRRRY